MLNRFAYRVYYEYQGPTHGDPLAAPEKDAAEIASALGRVPFELRVLMSDQDASVIEVPGVGFQHSLTFVVNTHQDEDSIAGALRKCLGSLDLFGGQLDPTTLTCPRCAALQLATGSEDAGGHLQPDETAPSAGGVKTLVSAGAPMLETVFKVYRCQDRACRTRWLRYANKADGQFAGWHLVAQDNA